MGGGGGGWGQIGDGILSKLGQVTESPILLDKMQTVQNSSTYKIFHIAPPSTICKHLRVHVLHKG